VGAETESTPDRARLESERHARVLERKSHPAATAAHPFPRSAERSAPWFGPETVQRVAQQAGEETALPDQREHVLVVVRLPVDSPHVSIPR